MQSFNIIRLPEKSLPTSYTKISNEILQYLIENPIPPAETRCLLFIFKKTWGYHKWEDWISLSQFEKATGLKKPHISRALKGLEAKGLIITKDGNRKIISIPKMVKSVTKNGTSALPKLATTKETITKEKIQKKEKSVFLKNDKRKPNSNLSQEIKSDDENYNLFLKMKSNPSERVSVDDIRVIRKAKNL